ncbi:MAG: GPI anchored serine-threonine rich family protein [Bacteroidetes bacterium]|nr:GPI anchored serine-threonine rich family protein [Bacteroidota bacterium]
MKAKLFFTTILLFLVLIFNSCSRTDLVGPEKISNDNNQTILDSLRIFSPQAGITWQPGTVQKITWSFPDVVKKVQIRLYKKQELRSILAIAYKNTGSFEWQIPAEILNSNHYRIQVFDVDAPILTKLSEYFFIVQSKQGTF